MQRKKMITLLSVGILGFGALFGAAAYRTGSVQAAAPTPATPITEVPAEELPAQMDRVVGMTDTYLADALGITVEELQTAQQAANTEALNQAVSAGLITQEQADRMAANDGTGRRGGFRIPGDRSIDTQTLLANALGIRVDELTDAQQQALTARLDQAVADGALTQDQADLQKARNTLANNTAFQDSLDSAYQAAIAQAVADGVITQAQADLILADQPTVNVFGHAGPGGFDGHHGGRSSPGGFGGTSSDVSPDASITPGGGL